MHELWHAPNVDSGPHPQPQTAAPLSALSRAANFTTRHLPFLFSLSSRVYAPGRTRSLSVELASTGLSWRRTGAQRGTVKEPDGAQIHTKGKAAERSVNVRSWRRALVWGFFFCFFTNLHKQKKLRPD